MSDTATHDVILYSDYAEQNIRWLSRFVFQFESFHIFSCYSYKIFETGLVEFEVMLKSNAGRATVLLPLASVAGILQENRRKNQFGFAHPEETRE